MCNVKRSCVVGLTGQRSQVANAMDLRLHKAIEVMARSAA